MGEFFLGLENLGVKPGKLNGRLAWRACEVVEAVGYEKVTEIIKECIEREGFEEGLEYEIIKHTNKLESNIIEFKPSEYIFYEEGLYGFIMYGRTPISKDLRSKMIGATGHNIGELLQMFFNGEY